MKTSTLQKYIIKIKNQKKKIVLCHGVFDLIHPGHINYFKSAKKFGDYLFVSVTSDRFINKGLGRPIFNQEIRINFLKQLKMIDQVILSDQLSAESVIELVKPNFYVKGPDYKINKDDRTKKILLEKRMVEKFGGKIKYTKDETYSSSELINKFGLDLNDQQLKFVKKIKKKFNFHKINNDIEKLFNLNPLVVGEIIIDEYCFGDAIGKASKEPHLVMNAKKKKIYLGGSLAIARNISTFVKKVSVFSYFGFEKITYSYIKNNINKNINLNLFKPHKDFGTVYKRRFIDTVSNYKLFGSYSTPEKDLKIDLNLIKKNFKKISNFDCIIICDYGHNLISEDFAHFLTKQKKKISLNVQMNSSSIGSDNLKKYKKIKNLFINENELRFRMKDYITDVNQLIRSFKKVFSCENLIVTRGTKGVMLLDKSKKLYKCPAFSINSVDKVGAGDCLLSIVSLLLEAKVDKELSLLIGNLAAATYIKSMGHEKPINKDLILNHLEYILK